MPHFFISYAKKDTRELAIALSDTLNRLEGVTAWVDRSLRAGRSWELQIQAEIDRCDTVIVLYSPDINRHKQGEEASYVLTEIAYAKFTAKKPIIPVMAQKTEPPISLTTAHYIDFTLDGLTLDDLIEAVCDEAGINSTYSSSLSQGIQDITSTTFALRNRVNDILPLPFEWVDIPAGHVTLINSWDADKKIYLRKGQARTFDVPAFKIAKYPITNAQFAQFIKAGGYQQKQWWTNDGWYTKAKEGWTQPRYWDDKKWTAPDCPIVGISWFEAVAFCLWLIENCGEKISLPTEQQWQRAAQGDDDRIYPWGNDWDCKRCNNSVNPCENTQTTPVQQYEGKDYGDSFFSVTDMVGNVWEWCLTDYATGKESLFTADVLVLRGSAWNGLSADTFRIDLRNGYYPNYRHTTVGVRLALSQ